MLPVLMPCTDTLLADEADRATRKWVERVVIGLDLCPFAKAVHARQQIRYAVTAARNAGELLEELEHEIDLLLASDPRQLDTTLLIHPLAMGDFLDYHFFVEDTAAALRRLGVEGVVQVAGFHPDYLFADSEPDDMANFTNRSPHPMLHLLRESSVDRAVAAFPDASEIFEANIRRLRSLGYEGWRKLCE